MNTSINTVLVIGATGSIGRLVVAETIQAGLAVRALSRNQTAARRLLPAQADVVAGDVTRIQTLTAALDGVDAVIFTHGADGGGKAGSRNVDYGAVSNVLLALAGRPVRIVLMTAIGVTNRTGGYNRATEAHDWKRRGERLVRASGLPYTIVRPGWFDYNGDKQHKLSLLQGDTRHAGDPSDGVIARQQLAAVLVQSLLLPDAIGKTFELVAEKGAAQTELSPLLAALAPDQAGQVDAVRDQDNMPLAAEPQAVLDDLTAVQQFAAELH